MMTVDFLIKEFPDGRLMLLFSFREGKNFRIHRKDNATYYTWCPHENDLKMADKIYKAIDKSNGEFIKNVRKSQDSRKSSEFKLFYT